MNHADPALAPCGGPDPDRMCRNCITLGAVRVPVGHPHGGQRDPVRKSVSLCLPCAYALVNGDLDRFGDRHLGAPALGERPDQAGDA